MTDSNTIDDEVLWRYYQRYPDDYVANIVSHDRERDAPREGASEGVSDATTTSELYAEALRRYPVDRTEVGFLARDHNLQARTAWIARREHWARLRGIAAQRVIERRQSLGPGGTGYTRIGAAFMTLLKCGVPAGLATVAVYEGTGPGNGAVAASFAVVWVAAKLVSALLTSQLQ